MNRRWMIPVVLACLWASPVLAVPIHDAALEGDVHRIRQLLAAGADVNAKDKGGNIPLHAAAYNGRTEAVKALLVARADVNATDDAGQTPLHEAMFMGHVRVAQALLAADADVNARNKFGLTPLNLAAFNGRAEAVKFLLDTGADVDVGVTTPLDSARFGMKMRKSWESAKRFQEVIRTLKAHGRAR